MPRLNPKLKYVCDYCGEEYMQWASQVNGKKNYCSKECYRKSSKGVEPEQLKGKGFRDKVSKICPHCGKEYWGTPGYLKRKKFCSVECAIDVQRKPDAESWRGVGQHKYLDWRKGVISRDGGVCLWCQHEGIINRRNLQVHHIVPVSKDADLVLDDNNAITLCREHHKIVTGRESEYAEFFASLINVQLSRPLSDCYKKRLTMDADELKRLFIEVGLSAYAIAKIADVSATTIRNHLRKNGVPTGRS